MAEHERRLWMALRQGLLLICGEIDNSAPPLWRAFKRGALLICGAIEREVRG
jgi:hypothetical protein